ncbi:restriction endonuclease subunit S [Anaerorudis cellulosivorans]|jgi:type I restriction enzyme S subunit|uniref:restriction endonuclease subunit S n=1 Tax=Anaerorudis cellulosivorans TaxID=3397862 RepID=UPI0022208660|nr:restriction endonuclease subunit S [Seramator thermalis]MCW1735478.1 restriction endonuclease subunit S [Seramator thermalis]
MSELKKYKLGDLGFFFGGVTSIKKEDYGHGTPFLPYKNVYKNSKVNVNELELMNVRPLDLERRNAVYGDIFFTASSETPDEVAMSSVLLDEVENLTFNGFCKRFRLNDFNTLLPEYARYLFRDISFRREVYQLATGDIRFNISQESLANIEIEIPDLPTQRQIAQILSSLDDKIELNLQMNQTLEAMAQAIFKEWFVDFNFPGFDGELVDGLPKGWRIVELSSLISVKDGTHDSPKQQQEGKYLITSKHLKNHFIDFSSAYKISDDDFNKVNKRSKVDRLDILITMIGTVGNLYFVHENEIDFAIKNIGLFKASERPDLAYFLYFTIDSKETSEYFTKRLAGSTQQYLTLETLRQTPILLPDDETLNSFNEYAKTIYERIDINSQNIHSLTQTRDTLLPKLMSGNIAVMNT